MTVHSSKKALLQTLESHNLKAKKKFGQNFLVNDAVLNSIIEASELHADDYIVEVGPGLGILTEALAQKAKKIDTIELDTKLIPYLQEKLKKFPQITLIHEDALKFALPKKTYKLIANLPYYITSPLLTHFLFPQKKEEFQPSLLTVLVQKEVADKICAKEGNHTILSLQVQIFGQPQIIKKIPPSAFYPEPKVDSAILKIKTYPEPLIDDPKFFLEIVKLAFTHKRKTLLNSLSSGLKYPKETTMEILEKAGISPQERPQNLKIDDWQRLLHRIKQKSDISAINCP